MKKPLLFLLPMIILLAGCSGDEPEFGQVFDKTVSRVRTGTVSVTGVDKQAMEFSRPYLLDEYGRYVTIKGINLSGSNKFPNTEKFPAIGEEISYVGKPFPLEDADAHFKKLRELGFNSVRLLMNWEAIEPYARGEYDEEYLDYFAAVVKKAEEHGIYVLVDMHQDIFSRHLYSYYNENPEVDRGTLEGQILSLVPPYTDWVRGDGAPRWVVEACLPEKNLDSPYWGRFRVLGSLEPALVKAVFANLDLLDKENGEAELMGILVQVAEENGIDSDTLFQNVNILTAINDLIQLLAGEGGSGAMPEWIDLLVQGLPGRFDVTESCDVLPWTFWGVNAAVSLDIERCFAAMFAGDKVFPDMEIEGQNIKDYLQEAYINAYLQVVKRVKDRKNVIGYDLMNEPIGLFVALTAASALVLANDEETVESLLTAVLGEDLGPKVHLLLTGLMLIPPDNKPETLEKWGLAGMDPLALLDLNLGLDGNYLQPFYEKLGQAVQAEDPNAIIWIEHSSGLRTVMGASAMFDVHMTHLEGIRQLVFAPHWYPDIYPFIGFIQKPREFKASEWTYRDFTENLSKMIKDSRDFLGNVPVVFGEFGTYFNYNGIDNSIADNYLVSSRILDSYYRAFEELGLGNMVWCYSPENTYDKGDGWNKEDFSVVDPAGEPRSWTAYTRPFARAASGKPVHSHFYSQHQYLDPDKGQVIPEREFVFRMESKETNAPTEIFVPKLQYPAGFYVWLSDGQAYWDDEHQVLVWHPILDGPEVVHEITVRPPLAGQEVDGWSYFITAQGDTLVGKGGVK